MQATHPVCAWRGPVCSRTELNPVLNPVLNCPALPAESCRERPWPLLLLLLPTAPIGEVSSNLISEGVAPPPSLLLLGGAAGSSCSFERVRSVWCAKNPRPSFARVMRMCPLLVFASWAPSTGMVLYSPSKESPTVALERSCSSPGENIEQTAARR